MSKLLVLLFSSLFCNQLLVSCLANVVALSDVQGGCTLTITVSPPDAGVTNPSEGTHVYPVNTSVDVFWIHGPYSMLDHWELNGTNVGEGNEPYQPSITVVMNASYVLTCVYYLIEPFKVISIAPLVAAVELGSSVNFVANVTGGLKPYSFQWYVNNTRVAMEPTGNWNFTPTAEGFYNVFLKTKDTWSSAVDWKQSDTATVTARNAIPEFPSIMLPLLLLMLTSLLVAILHKRKSGLVQSGF